MRSKMLGLAIALSTFGLGVAATTVWIAYHTPPAPQEIVMTRTVFVPSGLTIPAEGSAQDDSRITSSVSGTRIWDGSLVANLVNGEANFAPKPVYPPLALEAGVSGTVVVAVTIDKAGNVVSAKAVSGPQLLRAAATGAAMEWKFDPKFSPPSLQPVEVRRTITFNFLCQ
ncbi:MAG: periplasmic protein TonB [Acidobacteriota bacterium]|nr:periplasmic protein TonB [Acidobacteriota bacterium]